MESVTIGSATAGKEITHIAAISPAIVKNFVIDVISVSSRPKSISLSIITEIQLNLRYIYQNIDTLG